jgi:hypothetical protein
VIRTYERPLAAAEKRYISASISAAKKELQPGYVAKEFLQTLLAALVVSVAYSVWKSTALPFTLLVVATGAAAIYGLLLVDRYAKYRKRVGPLRLAQETGMAKVTEVEASRFASFEEFEDLGALFVFQVEPEELLVLQGQDFYETQRFPALSFAIVEVPGSQPMIRPSSPKAEPAYRYGPEVMRTIPNLPPLAHMPGTLESVLDDLKV